MGTRTQSAIDKAREIMESFDPTGAATVGYDDPTYTLTAEQMITIAGALYLADCEIHELNNRIKDLKRK